MDMLDLLDLDLTEPVRLKEPFAIIEEQDDPNDDFKLVTSNGQYTTGWCQSGGHEGTPKLSPRGSMMVACRGRYEFPRLVKSVVICNCWCHELFAKARAMEAATIADGTDATDGTETAASGDVGPVKIHVSTPIPEAGPGWFANPQPLTQSLYERLYDDPFLTDNLASMLAKYCKVAPHVVQRERRAGRRERGSLDVNVETVCRLIADKMIPFPGNPQVIAMLIDPDEGISSGAVYACLTRFMSEGLMESRIDTDKREMPVAFHGFKGDAIEMTVKEARRKIEQAAKRIGR